MTIRRTSKGHRALTAVAITTGLVLLVGGCGGGEDDDAKSGKASSPSASKGKDDSAGKQQQSQSPSDDQVLAEAKDGDITVTINSAVRDPGGFVTVSGQVRNGGSKSWLAANWQSDERELSGNGGSLSGANLVDRADKKKYLVLRDTSGRCLCTKFERLRPGDVASWFAQFPAPPNSTTKVDFQVGSMPPAPIDLSDGGGE